MDPKRSLTANLGIATTRHIAAQHTAHSTQHTAHSTQFMAAVHQYISTVLQHALQHAAYSIQIPDTAFIHCTTPAVPSLLFCLIPVTQISHRRDIMLRESAKKLHDALV